MKYVICEQMLNEYTDHPTDVEIGIIEAATLEEATKLAEMQYPNRGELKVVPVVEEN